MVHVQEGKPATRSLCRACYTKYMGRRDHRFSVQRNAEIEIQFTSMFVQLVEETCCTLHEERVSSCEETAAKEIEMLKKHQKPWLLRCTKRGRGTLGDRGGAYQKRCQGAYSTEAIDFVAVFVFTMKTTWSSTATRSDYFSTHFCGHCQCFPFSDCTWFACAGASQTMKQHRNKGSSWFCGRCGHIYKWRHGSRMLSLRYVSEQGDESLYEAFPMPQAAKPGQLGEVEPFFTSLKLIPNVIDNHLAITKCKQTEPAVTQVKPHMV